MIDPAAALSVDIVPQDQMLCRNFS